tara:strand:- start:98 stop:313 length:216 start_codon:yes stop_codon:yes gene_type:complete
MSDDDLKFGVPLTLQEMIVTTNALLHGGTPNEPATDPKILGRVIAKLMVNVSLAEYEIKYGREDEKSAESV